MSLIGTSLIGISFDRHVVDGDVVHRHVVDRDPEQRYLVHRDVVDRHLVDRDVVHRHVIDGHVVDGDLVDRHVVDRSAAHGDVVDRDVVHRDVVDRHLVDGHVVDRDVVDRRAADPELEQRVGGATGNRETGADGAPAAQRRRRPGIAVCVERQLRERCRAEHVGDRADAPSGLFVKSMSPSRSAASAGGFATTAKMSARVMFCSVRLSNADGDMSAMICSHADAATQRHRVERDVPEQRPDVGVEEPDVVDRDVVDGRAAQQDVVDRHVVHGRRLQRRALVEQERLRRHVVHGHATAARLDLSVGVRRRDHDRRDGGSGRGVGHAQLRPDRRISRLARVVPRPVRQIRPDGARVTVRRPQLQGELSVSRPFGRDARHQVGARLLHGAREAVGRAREDLYLVPGRIGVGAASVPPDIGSAQRKRRNADIRPPGVCRSADRQDAVGRARIPRHRGLRPRVVCDEQRPVRRIAVLRPARPGRRLQRGARDGGTGGNGP